MTVETLYASAHVTGSVTTPANALGAFNATWTTDTGNTSWTSRFSMANPTNTQANGTHTITVRARKEAGQSGNPEITSISLYDNGVLISQIKTTPTSVTSSASQDVSQTFAASLLSGHPTANLEVEVVGTAAGGNPSTRSAVQIDGIQWSGDFTVGGPPAQTLSPSAIASGETFGTAVLTMDGPVTTLSPTAIATEETWPTGGGGSGAVRCAVIHDSPTPTASDTSVNNFLNAHADITSTLVVENATTPVSSTDYDVVLISESGSSTAVGPYVNWPGGVVVFETAWSTLGLSTADASSQGGLTAVDLTAHAINSGFADPLTILSSSQTLYGVASSALTANCEIVANLPGSATAVVACAMPAGNNGAASGRRAGVGLISDRPLSLNTAGQDWIIAMVQWAANVSGGGGGVVVTQDAATVVLTPTAIGSVEAFGTTTAAGPGQQFLNPTSIASGEAFTSGGESNPDLPVQITTTGVEPESHSYNPVIIDSNGNLYRILESQLAANNQPRAMKSTDGGETWVEQDAANRPGTDVGSIGDLESGWTTWDANDKQITFTWQRSYVVWSGFRTSDHATNPDTWVSNTREEVISQSGSPQFASHTSPTNQSYEWIFANTSGAPQYRSRTGSGNYGTVQNLDSAGAVPAAILDANNISHIIYTKSSQIHLKELTSGGTLDSASTRVDSNGIHTVAIPFAAPQAYVSGGSTYLGVLFLNSSAHLKFVLVTNGTPGSEETITTTAVLTDPGITGNSGAICSLAVDPTDGTMHATWVESSTGDVKHAERPHGGSWGTITTLQNPAFTPAWIYSKVNTYPDSLRVLSYTYSNPVGDDQNIPWYGEMVIAGGGGAEAIQVFRVYPTAIGSAEAFGVHEIPFAGQTLSAQAIASAETFGTHALTTTISINPTAIASSEAHGSHSVSTAITSTPVGIASAETHGSPSVATAITTSPVGVSTAEAFGSPTLNSVISLSATGISSAEAFGSPILSAVISISPTAIGSAEAFGTASLSATITLTAVGIATAESVGNPTLSMTITLTATGITSAEAFGSPLADFLSRMFPNGIVTQEAFGTPVLTATVTISPSAIASAEQFGTALIDTSFQVTAVGIPSAEAMGAPSLSMTISLAPSAIGSQEAFGSPSLSMVVVLSPSGIVSTEQFGVAETIAISDMQPDSIPSAEAFGSHTITTTITISPTGVASEENFGTPVLVLTISIAPVGISSEESHGSPTFSTEISLSPVGLSTEEAFGNPDTGTGLRMSPEPISSAQIFGAPSITTLVGTSPTGIESEEEFGTPEFSVLLTLSPNGILTAEILGSPEIVIGGVELSPGGILSAEEFGSAVIGLGALDLAPTGIPTDEAFGTVTAHASIQIQPVQIGSEEAFSIPFLSVDIFLFPAGISSGEVFGAVRLVVPILFGSEDTRIRAEQDRVRTEARTRRRTYVDSGAIRTEVR